MESNERNKRDLPEVVADILIEQHAIRQTLEQMQQQMLQQNEQLRRQQEQMNNGFDRLEHAFNSMTTAVLDAMNRQTNRYHQTADTRHQAHTDVVDLARRVEAPEKQVFNKAG